MSRVQFRLLADDLTGALDSAAAFASPVPVHLDKAPADTGAAPVVAAATATRDIAPADLPGALAGVAAWFGGGGLAFKKVDSLLRGNTFHEVAHLARHARDGGFDGVVFAPAFPAQGRLTVAGRQQVQAADGVATPAGPPIAEAFAALGLAVQAGPAADTAAVLARSGRDAAPTVWLPEVRSAADLLAIAAQATTPAGARWLWCGSAGLAQALAAVLGLAGDAVVADDEAPPASLPRRALVIGASHQPVVRRQWTQLRSTWPGAVQVQAGDPAQFEVACAVLARPLAHWDVALLELSPLRPLSAAQAADLLQGQLAALAAPAAGIARPQHLLVIGGDTLLGLCRATGVQALHTRPAPRAGWGSAGLAGGRWDGLAVHSRSGAFGGDDDLVRMLARVTGA